MLAFGHNVLQLSSLLHSSNKHDKEAYSACRFYSNIGLLKHLLFTHVHYLYHPFRSQIHELCLKPKKNSLLQVLVLCWFQFYIDLGFMLVSILCWSRPYVGLNPMLVPVPCWSWSYVGPGPILVLVLCWSLFKLSLTFISPFISPQDMQCALLFQAHCLVRCTSTQMITFATTCSSHLYPQKD